MTILNAGIGALQHDGSPISTATDLVTTPGTFDPQYTDRAVAVTGSTLRLYFAPQGASVPSDYIMFRCMLYIESGSTELWPSVQVTSDDGRNVVALSRVGTNVVGVFSRYNNISETFDVDSSIPRDQLFEFAAVMEAGQPARYYVDGILIHESTTGRLYPSGMSFGGNSSTTTAPLFIRNNRTRPFYVSEPLVATSDATGVRVREMFAQANHGAVDYLPEARVNDPGSSANVAVGFNEDVLLSWRLAGVGNPDLPIIGTLVSASVSANDLDDWRVSFTEDRPLGGPQTTNASSAILPRTDFSDPTRGEALGTLFETHPLTEQPWTEGTLEDTRIGVRYVGSSTPSETLYSLSPVLLYGGSPAIDPLDGALVTSGVSYTVHLDEAALFDALGLKLTSAVSYAVLQDLDVIARLSGPGISSSVSYTVFEREREPELTGAITYIVGSPADEPQVIQGVSYTLYRDEAFLARQLGASFSSAIRYTVFGRDGRADLSAGISYVIGRPGDDPRVTQGVSYLVLGAGDPAALFQSISYIVLAPEPPPPFIPVITIGKYRY